MFYRVCIIKTYPRKILTYRFSLEKFHYQGNLLYIYKSDPIGDSRDFLGNHSYNSITIFSRKALERNTI